MPEIESERRWVWVTLMLSSISIVALVFAFWELVENHLFSDLNYVSLHYLYISRGIASSLLLALWAAWYVLRVHRYSEEELRASREHYRGLLDASPAAIVLFDGSFRVKEWNAAAQSLYAFTRTEVLEQRLPTVRDEAEFAGLMRDLLAGGSVLEQDSTRVARNGEVISVQVSLLPYDENGTRYFLEVTSDNRERIKLRQTLIEVEKLTTMGMMAAGTAHHLNTPLASMLLRTQMLRERLRDHAASDDLARLESNIGFCQQFVRRLLDFSRRPTFRQQPEEIATVVEAVLGFLLPTALTRHVQLTSDFSAIAGCRVVADRNEIETMVLILVSNAIDAVRDEGSVRVSGQCVDGGSLELRVTDNGCGIRKADLSRVFQPFFTTKPAGKGTGLGLSIARNIALGHSGSIELHSDVNRGTEVVVRLPLCSREQHEVAS